MIYAITYQNWRAEELHARQVFPDFPPSLSDDDYIWSPSFWVAVAQELGMSNYGVSTVRGWEKHIAPRHLGRTVVGTTAEDVMAGKYQDMSLRFIKLEDVKNNHFPAQYCGDGGYAFVRSILNQGAPADTGLLLSDYRPVLGEHRALIVNGEVRSVQPYAHIGQAEIQLDASSPDPRSFVQDVVSALDEEWFPRSYALDVGYTSASSMMVVEANPIWASGWYGDSDVMIEALRYSRDCGLSGQWQPDPWLASGARQWVYARQHTMRQLAGETP